MQDDFKLRAERDAERRAALGLHLAAGRAGQPADATSTCETGEQIVASDGSIEDRALYQPYYGGFEPRLGVGWSISDRCVVRGGYGISQFMEGTGANLRLPLNPPFFFESAVTYDTTTGAGSGASGFAGLIPGTVPPATSAPTIRTCGRSSRSSGTRSSSTR